MFTVKAADAGAVLDLASREAEREQLPGRDHAVLPIGQFGDRPLASAMRLSFATTVVAFLRRIEWHRC
jgi:hypothetical protein